jgi:tetratricopeptide repeat protein 8
VDKLDLKKLAKKPVISRVLCDYLIYVEHNPKKVSKYFIIEGS